MEYGAKESKKQAPLDAHEAAPNTSVGCLVEYLFGASCTSCMQESCFMHHAAEGHQYIALDETRSTVVYEACLCKRLWQL